MREPTEARPRKERKANADRRRRQLLDAARRSILRHGLARTTLATVASEAGLSQGVVVFYFKSKAGLLTETLRDLYSGYEAFWTAALAAAGPTPRDRIMALIRADFAPEACGPEVLPIWFAFWGELRFTRTYAEVAALFDAHRRAVIGRIWADLLPDHRPEDIGQLAEWVDIVTDGYWQRLYLSPERLTAQEAVEATWSCLVKLAPELVQAATPAGAKTESTLT
jgi:TetR/AcrR family transcriptional regulator, transcriptional repressor of bet genes